MSSGPFESITRETRLDTWKSIALYLGRSSRTVQRWHAAYALPVHHLGGESGSVYAFSQDLDDWLRKRGRPHPAHDPIPGHEGSLDDAVSLPATTEGKTSGFSIVSDQASLRSTQLMAHASKLWETFSHQSLPLILHHYREAIDLNPGNAAAYAGLSLGLSAQAVWNLINPRTAFAAALAALEKAETIHPQLPFATCAASWLKMLASRDWRGAQIGFDDTLEQANCRLQSLHGRALLCIAQGDLAKGSGLLVNGAHESPLSSACRTLHCWSLYLSGDSESALRQVQETRALARPGPVLDAVEALAAVLDPDPSHHLERVEALAAESPHHNVLTGALGYGFAVTGQFQRARAILKSMTDLKRSGAWLEPYGTALTLVGLEEPERAIDCLHESYRGGSLWSLGFRSDPLLAALRSHPQFSRFLDDCRYPESTISGTPSPWSE